MSPAGRRLVAVVLLLSVAASACGDGGSEPASEGASTSSSTSSTTTTTTPSASSTTSATSPPDESCSGGRSSPSTFDAAGGRYAVILRSLDVDERMIGFDVIQFLLGDDAVDAYHEDFPEDPEGPPNDYYIVNDNPLVRQAPVDPDVLVRLVRLQEDGSADLDPGTFEELPGYLTAYQLDDPPQLSYNPFWLTLEDGSVTEICEQYVP
jgi:hypothetical protein